MSTSCDGRTEPTGDGVGVAEGSVVEVGVDVGFGESVTLGDGLGVGVAVLDGDGVALIVGCTAGGFPADGPPEHAGTLRPHAAAMSKAACLGAVRAGRFKRRPPMIQFISTSLQERHTG
jgi:hypothetical protein